MSSMEILSATDISTIVRNSEAVLELHERIGLKIASVEAELGWSRLRENEDPVPGEDDLVRTALQRIASILLEEVRYLLLQIKVELR